MIDPVTIGVAFAGAKATVAGIKEVIKLGKDVGEISSSIIEYFNHKSVIEKAERIKQREIQDRRQNKNSPKKQKKTDAEITAEAMEIVIKRKTLEREEYKLYEMLIWSGNGDIWHDMCTVREEMRKRIRDEEAEELRLQMIHDQKMKERKELLYELGLCALAVFILGVIFYGIVQFGISEGLWAARGRKYL